MPKQDKNQNLKNIIKEAMDDNGGKIKLEDAKELIRPYFNYDIDKLIDKALTDKTRYIIYSFTDKKGIRICVANDESLYIDLTADNSVEDIRKAAEQIRKKVYGMMKLWHKVRDTQKEIDGQITFDELDGFLVEQA